MKANERKIVGFLYYFLKLGAIFGLLRTVLRSTVQRIILQSTYSPTVSHFQEEDNNDVNQVVASSAFSEKTRVWVGFSVSRNHRTWSRWFLLKDFLFKITQASVWKRGVFDITMTFFILMQKKKLTSTTHRFNLYSALTAMVSGTLPVRRFWGCKCTPFNQWWSMNYVIKMLSKNSGNVYHAWAHSFSTPKRAFLCMLTMNLDRPWSCHSRNTNSVM